MIVSLMDIYFLRHWVFSQATLFTGCKLARHFPLHPKERGNNSELLIVCETCLVHPCFVGSRELGAAGVSAAPEERT